MKKLIILIVILIFLVSCGEHRNNSTPKYMIYTPYGNFKADSWDKVISSGYIKFTCEGKEYRVSEFLIEEL